MQAHSLPLTTPLVLPPLPLPLPPVSGDFLISANFPPIPAKLVQKIRRWESVEFPQPRLRIGGSETPQREEETPSDQGHSILVFGNVALHSNLPCHVPPQDWGNVSLHGQNSPNQLQPSGGGLPVL